MPMILDLFISPFTFVICFSHFKTLLMSEYRFRIIICSLQMELIYIEMSFLCYIAFCPQEFLSCIIITIPSFFWLMFCNVTFLLCLLLLNLVIYT